MAAVLRCQQQDQGWALSCREEERKDARKRCMGLKEKRERGKTWEIHKDKTRHAGGVETG
ncbi:uncharacterized protein ColSpa_11877 [Colletotrichum spaethianum]|uniref:Uncharacterized protein n=1 Tax=Colletotrichum spaethianum TaxID=700344 RepID=A0AA37PG53_9PEZI|nr:uncharacterized protein ColSpa_11877 [Colletotrichum spaethianum]GKT51696.1 hypothetical protein ColSpa_11877 [Colletotrichum spaethianum]